MSDWKELAKNPGEWDSLEPNDPRLDDFAHAVEDRYGLPRGLVEAIKNAGERTPSVKSGKPRTSPKGAKGLMQFMPETRAKYEHNIDDPFESIDAAGRYLGDVMKQYKGNALAAVADYNGGPRQASAIVRGDNPPALETREYLKRVKAYMDRVYGGKEESDDGT